MKTFCKYVFLLIAFASATTVFADTELTHGRHSFRLGWGLGNNQPYKNYIDITKGDPIDPMEAIHGMTSAEAHAFLQSYRKAVNMQYFNRGHIYLAYQYYFNHWLSVGLELDWLRCRYSTDYLNGYGDLVVRARTTYLDLVTFMPTVRFTYFRSPLLELYSGLGLGYTLCADSFSSHGFTISPTLFGVNLGNEHWFAEVELGGMTTVVTSWIGTTGVFFSSRIVSAAVGYRF